MDKSKCIDLTRFCIDYTMNNMESELLTISQTAEIIGVSIQTLRRWDDSGKLRSIRKKKTTNRYYRKNDIEKFIQSNLKNLFRLAKKWTSNKSEEDLPSAFYCQDISIFQARLSRLERDLGGIKKLNKIFPLISAITGEIGNNSFDHNLGNWLDMPGIFFAYDLNKGEVILADRGQGILTTLKKIRPKLSNDQDALKVAFTEIISGRAPEYRGNGLKFVRNVIANNEISLFFQTGNAQLKIKKNNSDLEIKKSNIHIQGCLALIKF
ncbi:MerR family transcriptional regulator [Patescibacteria group bacterium]